MALNGLEKINRPVFLGHQKKYRIIPLRKLFLIMKIKKLYFNRNYFFKIPDEEKKEDSFIDGSIIKALNKCRNPLKDPQGPYCYTLSQELIPFVSKSYCHIRTCRSFGNVFEKKFFLEFS